MKLIYAIFALLVVASGLAGCNNSTQADPPAFTSSSMWLYSNDSLGINGNIISSRTDTTTADTTSFSNSIKHIEFSDQTVATLQDFGSGYQLTGMSVLTSLCGSV